jgi:hypothetical protein
MIAESARRIATLLDANPVRGGGSYPIGDVVRGLDAELAVLRGVVAETPGPLAMAEQVALLMMCLQHIVVLCHGYEELPDDLRVQARRELSTAHQTARRLAR